MARLLFFIPFCCCCDHKLQQTVMRSMMAGRAHQKSRLSEKGRRTSLHGCFSTMLHHGQCKAWASKAQLQRQQKTARIYEGECRGALPPQRAGMRGAASKGAAVDVEESITVWYLWSLSIVSPAIDTNHSEGRNSAFGIVFRQKRPIVACNGGLPAGAWPFNAHQVRSSARYRWRDQVHLGLPPFL